MGVSLQTWSQWRNEVEAALVAYHRANPLRAGMQLEELRRQLDLGPDLFGLLVEGLEDASVVLEAGRVRLLDFEVKLSEQQQAQVEALVGVMREAGAKPPDAEEVKRRVAEPLFHYLVDQGTLVELPDGIVLLKTSYRSWVRQIKTAMRERGPLTVAQIRDTLGTTRKYVLPLLARLDAEGVTVRQGDVRRLGEGERDR
jgi:selenocysteine-specific elongation factor